MYRTAHARTIQLAVNSPLSDTPMTNQRLIILALLIAYIFSPTVFTWMINPEGAWYRPYIIWAMLIVAAFVLQKRKDTNDL